MDALNSWWPQQHFNLWCCKAKDEDGNQIEDTTALEIRSLFEDASFESPITSVVTAFERLTSTRSSVHSQGKEDNAVEPAVAEPLPWETSVSQFSDDGLKRRFSKSELHAGIRVEKVYDIYDPSTRRIRESPMSKDVLHRRSTSMLEPTSRSPCNSPADSPNDSPPTAKRASATRPVRKLSTKERKERAKLDDDATKKDPKLPESRTHENITNWGVVVARLIYYVNIDHHDLLRGATRVRLRLCSKTPSTQSRVSPSGRPYVQLGGVLARAQAVVDQAKRLMRSQSKQEDIYDYDWEDPGLLWDLYGAQYSDTLMLLATAGRRVVSSQPTLAEAHAPCMIFGDIHGQFRDLLLLFHAFGSPSEKGPSFVFNGDFVDRGDHQLEVVGLLFAYKLLYPDKIWLIRGNHEERSMNQKYGFHKACMDKLGKQGGGLVFESFQKAFDQLPLACLVSGRLLIVHGGIGDGRWNLKDLRALERPLGDKKLRSCQWAMDLLWSDPIEDKEDSDAHAVFGVHASARMHQVHKFGWNVTKTFCAKNGLSLIVRSHQCRKDGKGFEVMHDEMLMRVFSARDYEGNGNDGAVLKVTTDQTMLTVRPQVICSLTKAQRPRRRTSKPSIRVPSKDGSTTTASPTSGRNTSKETHRASSLESATFSPNVSKEPRRTSSRESSKVKKVASLNHIVGHHQQEANNHDDGTVSGPLSRQ